MSGWAAVGQAASSIASSVIPTMVEGLYNKKEAKKTREFQDKQRATAYQDTMADMHAAGLNPILAYKQGATSTPSAPTASINAKPINLSAAAELANTRQQTSESKSRVNLQQEQASRETQQANLLLDQQVKTQQEKKTSTALEHLYNNQATNVSLSNQMDALRLQIANSAKQAHMTKGTFRSSHPNLQKFDAVMESIGKLLGGGSSAADIYKKTR